jgi:hypothetical protein
MPTTFADGVQGSGSLRDAVLQFNADPGSDDDVIQLQAGTYTLTVQNTGGHHETAGLEGDLNITSTAHRLILQGAGSSGANATIVDASQLQDRTFEIVTPGTVVVFQDLVIRGGLAQDDGSDGALAGSTDALGGGILNNGGHVTLNNVALTNNVARGNDVAVPTAPGHNGRGGGIYSTGGALTLAGATLANNPAIGGPGGDASGRVPAGDGGSGCGGGLYATGGSLDVSESMITSDQVSGGQGGDGGRTVFMSIASGNGGSGLGGGLYVNGGSLTIATSSIASNHGTPGSAGSFEGHIGQLGSVAGQGLYNGGTLTVSDSTLSGNAGFFGTFGDGGGIYNGGTLTVSNSTLSGNSAELGGGIENFGTLTVSNSTLSGNSGGDGGGIYNGGTLTVSNSTLSGNSASDGGGISNSGTLTVSNSTLSGNSGSFEGGGIATSGTHSVTLTNVTLTANRASSIFSGPRGGGLYASSGSPVLHNTLIAGNFKSGTTRDDVYGALNSGGDYNLIGDGIGMTGVSDGVNGNLVGSASSPIDPLLGPLQDNGGPTKTRALLAGSPALNAGDAAFVGTADQRGVVRNGGVNIGAYQASASAFVLTPPATTTAGTPFDVTVAALDAFGQVALGYTGTVTFGTTDADPAVVLPADYTFTAGDQGTHTFSGGFTLVTTADQTLTVTDLDGGFGASVLLGVQA